MIPCPPPAAYETRLMYTDVLNKSQGQTLEIVKMTRIRENAPPYDAGVDSICTSCSTECYQCSGAGFNIKCSACRGICPARRFRAHMGSRLTHLNERNGRWMPAYYQADPMPYNLPGPRGGRHFLTRDNGDRNVVFFNQCVQAEIDKNISMELDRIYQRDRSLRFKESYVHFRIGSAMAK